MWRCVRRIEKGRQDGLNLPILDEGWMDSGYFGEAVCQKGYMIKA